MMCLFPPQQTLKTFLMLGVSSDTVSMSSDESRYFQTSAEDIHICEILMTNEATAAALPQSSQSRFNPPSPNSNFWLRPRGRVVNLKASTERQK